MHTNTQLHKELANFLNDNADHPNLVAAFWINHLNFTHFLNSTKGWASLSNFDFSESSIKKIRNKVYEIYSPQINENFATYDIIEFVSKHHNNLNDSISHITNTCMKEKLTTLLNDVNEITQKLSAFIKKYSPHINELEFKRKFFLREKLTAITEILAQYRNHTKFIQNKVLYTGMKSDLKTINESIDNLSRYITEIRQHLHSCKSLLNRTENGNYQQILNELIFMLRFGNAGQHNLEIVYIFLFEQKPESIAGTIERYEAYFTYIYELLKQYYPDIDDILFYKPDVAIDELCKPYIICNDAYKSNNRLNFFMLLKLIKQYKFYLKVSNTTITSAEALFLERLEEVLRLTKMPYIEYIPVFSNLQSYIMSNFGINNKELSKILSVTEGTISRNKNSNEFLKKHLWFWAAVTGYTLDFLEGNSTLEYYGRNANTDSNRYLKTVAAITAASETFLTMTDYLVSFKNQLSSSGNSKKYVLSDKYLSIIAAHSKELTDLIRKQREKIDNLQEKYQNYLVEVQPLKNINRTQSSDKSEPDVASIPLKALEDFNEIVSMQFALCKEIFSLPYDHQKYELYNEYLQSLKNIQKAIYNSKHHLNQLPDMQ